MSLQSYPEFAPPIQALYDLTATDFEPEKFLRACALLGEQDTSMSFDDLAYFKLHLECPLKVSLWREETIATVSSAILSFVYWESPFEVKEKAQFDNLYGAELSRANSILGEPAFKGQSQDKEKLKYAIWLGKKGILVLQQSDHDPQFGLDINYWIQHCDIAEDFSKIKDFGNWLLQINLLPPCFKLPEGWEICGPGFENELERELAINLLHPLRSVKASSVAKAIAHDDVLFRLYGHSHPLAEVHLTWSREWRREWPDFELFRSWQDWGSQNLELDD